MRLKTNTEYQIIGHPQDWYIFRRKDGMNFWSNWYKGAEAFRDFHRIKNLDKARQMAELEKLCERLGRIRFT